MTLRTRRLSILLAVGAALAAVVSPASSASAATSGPLPDAMVKWWYPDSPWRFDDRWGSPQNLWTSMGRLGNRTKLVAYVAIENQGDPGEIYFKSDTWGNPFNPRWYLSGVDVTRQVFDRKLHRFLATGERKVFKLVMTWPPGTWQDLGYQRTAEVWLRGETVGGESRDAVTVQLRAI